jgi:hypothetical protein
MVVIRCACLFSPNRVVIEKMAMRKISLVLFALAMSAGRAFAQDRDSVSKTATIVMARWGERVESNAVSSVEFNGNRPAYFRTGQVRV